MKSNYYLIILITLIFSSCSSDDSIYTSNDPSETLYFPPIGSDTWGTISLSDLNWNENNLQPLLNFVEEKDSKAFIILKNGKIVVEWYGNGFTQNELWYWASAGKVLTATTVGIAQQEGFLDINNQTNDYLGDGWTDTSQSQEDEITVLNQLEMTSGLDELLFDCTDSECLLFKADASTRWSYHNAPYTLLQSVVGNAVSTNFENYFKNTLRDKIGMNGSWFSTNGFNNVYFSSPRSMARFGLLILNNGSWDTTEIVNENYVSLMTNTSQNINKSYGYLWWLNGKESFILPESQVVFNRMLIPNAPTDLVAGLGKNDQKLYIVPSQNLVIIRMGEIADEDSLVPITFDNELWEKINDVIN